MLTLKNGRTDHIVPISRGGTNTKENVQFLHCDVNVAKGNLLERDFLAVCQDVVNFTSLTGKAMTQLEAFQTAKKKIDDLIEERNNIAKDAFAEASKSLFDAHPILKSISWTQYTPYFNDGDPCEFSAHTEYPDLEFTDGTGEEDAGTYEIQQKNERGEPLTPAELATEAVFAFLSVFDDEDYENLFGDGTRVTVARQADGSVACETSDFEHD